MYRKLIVNSGTAQDATFDPINISSLEFWAQPAPVRDRAFAELRRERPVSFHPPISFGLAGMLPTQDPGFWAVATCALVREASRNAEVFSTAQGVTMEDIPPEFSEEVGSFLVMDGVRHATLRRLISSTFTPRNVARIEAQITGQARRIIDRLVEMGDCDFVHEVSMQLPMWTVSEMIGIPDADRDRIANAANALVAASDPEFATEATALTTILAGQTELKEAAVALAAERRVRPRDDLMTALVQAEVDGRRLTDQEIGSFMVLLGVAGNDTTRQTTSHAMRALCDNPDQRKLLTEDLGGGLVSAVEEFIRRATPVMQFRRTATANIVFGGQHIRAGEKIVLLYTSANRDESVFADPWRFDVTRSPNDHLGFGGGGPHYCLGAHLARSQLRSLFRELLSRVPQLEVGDPEYLTANFIHGIKRMPCTL